jgi:hypothetical protein
MGRDRKSSKPAPQPVPQSPSKELSGNRRFAPWMRRTCMAAALFLAVLLAYSNSFHAGFAFDSSLLILQDARVHQANGANFDLILNHTYWWPSNESGLYRPVTTLSYLFNYAILGDGAQPDAYHWINFLLHVFNVFLVYLLAVHLVRRVWPAFFVAAVWAVHPVLTESVREERICLRQPRC